MSKNKEYDAIVDMILKIFVDKQVSLSGALNISHMVQREIQASMDSAWDNPLVINENE